MPWSTKPPCNRTRGRPVPVSSQNTSCMTTGVSLFRLLDNVEMIQGTGRVALPAVFAERIVATVATAARGVPGRHETGPAEVSRGSDPLVRERTGHISAFRAACSAAWRIRSICAPVTLRVPNALTAW